MARKIPSKNLVWENWKSFSVRFASPWGCIDEENNFENWEILISSFSGVFTAFWQLKSLSYTWCLLGSVQYQLIYCSSCNSLIKNSPAATVGFLIKCFYLEHVMYRTRIHQDQRGSQERAKREKIERISDHSNVLVQERENALKKVIQLIPSAVPQLQCSVIPRSSSVQEVNVNSTVK